MQPGRVVFRLEPGDLALDQGLRAAAGRRHLDGDGRPDGGMDLRDHVASRVAEGDGEHVGQVLVMIDDDLLEQRLGGTGERGSVDVDVGPQMIGLRHANPC